MSAQEFVDYMLKEHKKDLKKYLTEFNKTNSSEIIIYTDGSMPNNKLAKKMDLTGGLGVYIIMPDKTVVSISEKVLNSTNNIAELKAIEKALDFLSELTFTPTSVTIFSDSMYCINSVTKWYKTWIVNGWKTSKGTSVENKELINNIISKIGNFSYFINFKHVKAHSGIYGNEMADVLAVAGSKK